MAIDIGLDPIPTNSWALASLAGISQRRVLEMMNSLARIDGAVATVTSQGTAFHVRFPLPRLREPPRTPLDVSSGVSQ